MGKFYLIYIYCTDFSHKIVFPGNISILQYKINLKCLWDFTFMKTILMAMPPDALSECGYFINGLLL